MKRKKPEPTDGLGPNELKRIHGAVRKVWQWSRAWHLAKKRAMGEDGYPRCESKDCPSRGGMVPKHFIDHIDPVGEVGGPKYIQRMFVPSSKLQALCKKCHDAKTKAERA